MALPVCKRRTHQAREAQSGTPVKSPVRIAPVAVAVKTETVAELSLLKSERRFEFIVDYVDRIVECVRRSEERLLRVEPPRLALAPHKLRHPQAAVDVPDVVSALLRRIMVETPPVGRRLVHVFAREAWPAEPEEVVALDLSVPDVFVRFAPDALHLRTEVVRAKAQFLVDGGIFRFRDALRPLVAAVDVVVSHHHHAHGTRPAAEHLVERLLVELHLAHHAAVGNVPQMQHGVRAVLLEILVCLMQNPTLSHDVKYLKTSSVAENALRVICFCLRVEFRLELPRRQIFVDTVRQKLFFPYHEKLLNLFYLN